MYGLVNKLHESKQEENKGGTVATKRNDGREVQCKDWRSFRGIRELEVQNAMMFFLEFGSSDLVELT